MTLEQRISALAAAIGADIKAINQAMAGAGAQVFIQQTEPAAELSPFIWYKTDADGKVIDILKG